MARIVWMHRIAIVATLVMSAGAISILLFAM
jgi:hypothetical protein